MKTNIKLKKRNTIEYLIYKNIILIILLVIILYFTIGLIADFLSESKMLSLAEKYSADYIFSSDDYKSRTDKISEVKGWSSLLDENLKVISSSNSNEIDKYTLSDLLSLNKGEYSRTSNTYYASIKEINNNGNIEYGIAIIPKSNISIVYTVTNPIKEVKSILIILLIRIIVFIVGFGFIIYAFSLKIKENLSIPITEIESSFNKIEKGHYDVKLRFDSTSEFNNIKNSFNYMTKKLNYLNEERKNNERKKHQLFSDIGHDLKTPITIIKGYSEAFINDKIKKEDYKKKLYLIYKNAKHMDYLIKSLFELINYDRFDYRLNKERTDICEFFRLVIIQTIAIFEENNIETEINTPQYKVLLEIDKDLMQRVILNLLSNIVDHNPKGIKALFEIYVECNKINIIIADSGNPITHDIKKDIFDPFVRVEQSRNKYDVNNGLGLSIVKNILNLHNVEIDIIDNYKCYTKAFVIIFPLIIDN